METGTAEEKPFLRDKDEEGLIGVVYWIGRLLLSLAVPLIFFVVMRAGFIWLREGEAHQLVIALVAILWGIGGTALLFIITNWLVEKLPNTWREALLPFVFVGPAMAVLGWYLLVPALRSLQASFYDKTGDAFVGMDNYAYAFTDRIMREAFRNNLMWLILGTGLCIVFGLIVAVLADRTHPAFEVTIKSLIFLPMAISFIGAGVIWNFVYARRPPGQEQIGILNAIWTAFGGEPVGWLTQRPWNTPLLIIVLVWMYTGYAMVILSAALKNVPRELLEAGRIDGATEVQVFFRIMIPYIWGTIITVGTSILILTLKIFDIVWAMTGGNFGTNVIGTVFWRQMFTFDHDGRASAIAILLLILVIPVMWYNLRQFQEQEAF